MITTIPVRIREKKIFFFFFKGKNKVPPRFELGLLDSESNVLTTRPWDLADLKSLMFS